MRISRLSQRQVRIGVSGVIALLLVVGAYVIPGLTFPRTKEANAALTDELLAKYVAKDTDGDGLPDWQEALYGTDPNKADTDGDGVSDGEAVKRGLLTPTALRSQLPEDPSASGPETVPGITPADPNSITDQFARAFFQAYVDASNGQPMDEATQQQLVTKLLADFTQRASATLDSKYTAISIRTGDTSDEASYLSSVESILQDRTVGTVDDANPLLLMQALIMNNDESARRKLTTLAGVYESATQQLLSMHVPPQYRNSHLELLRSFDTLSKATRMVAQYEKDPVGTMGALATYQPAFQGVIGGTEGIAETILQSHEPAQGEPGYVIVSASRRAQQQP